MPEIKEVEEKKKKSRSLKRCRGKKRSSALKRCGEEESSTGEKRRKKITTSLVLLQTERNRCVYDLTSNQFFPARVNYINYKVPNNSDVKFLEETYLDVKTEPLKIKKGKRLRKDVCSLLSNDGKINYLVRNNGERVKLSEAITGKYLIICCVYVPMLSRGREAHECRALINTYTELKKERDDFEMVMVAKMRCSFIAEDEEEPFFNRFFSEFPCLAVPFEEESSRNMICKLLGLGTGTNQPFRSTSVFLILDPTQKVLQKDVNDIEKYGAAFFPFTDDHLDSLDSESTELGMRLDPAERYLWGDPENPVLSKPLTLEELFCCESSMPLRQCVGDNEISVSQLSESYCVALYVCFDGLFMSRLESIRKKCVGKELEIVIIYQPAFSEESSYFEAVKSALEKNNISSWWVLPFRDKVSRRLYNIGNNTCRDNVIIWANGGLDGEMDGAEFMQAFDYSYYPFTKNSVADAKIDPLMSLTLESFLGENGGDKYKGQSLNVPALKNRNILLYLGSSSSALYKQLCDLYKHIKEDYPDSEVICLVDDPSPVSEIPFPHLSGPIAIPKGVENPPTLVAFGKDNKIISLHAEEHLGYREEKGVSLFEDTLRAEFLEEVFDWLR